MKLCLSYSEEEMIIFSFELYFRNHTTVDFPYDIGVTSLTINKEQTCRTTPIYIQYHTDIGVNELARRTTHTS